MRKVILSAAICLTLLLASAAPALAKDYFISPSGDDGNSGTLSSPFKTIAHAQEFVRGEISKGISEPLNVYLRTGNYELSFPLTFTGADSGTDQFPITYQGYQEEKPVISGGKVLPKSWIKGNGSIWKLSVPGLTFQSLFLNGARLTKARFPNVGTYMKVTAVNPERTQIIFDKTIPGNPDWTAATGAQLVTLYNWETARTPIIQSKQGVFNGVVTIAPVGVAAAAGGQLAIQMGDNVFVEGARALLDTPGEWYLDTNTSTLFYYAGANEDPNSGEFVVPTLSKLISIQGSASSPAANLNFDNLTFQYSDWSIPPGGYDGEQGNYYFTSKTSQAQNTQLAPAILLEYSKNIGLSNLIIRHIGMAGVGIGTNTAKINLDHSTITDIGGNCINLGWSDVKKFAENWAAPENTPDNITVSNNKISRCGQIFFGGIGISSNIIKNSLITHNLVFNLPYTGISVMARMSVTKPTYQENIVVSFNQIHDVMNLLSDGGAIYTTGNTPNGKIKSNLIYNVNFAGIVEPNKAINNAIFTDQGTTGWTINNNISYSIAGSSLRQNLAGANIIGTNYFDTAPGSANYPATIADQTGPVAASTTPAPATPTPNPTTPTPFNSPSPATPTPAESPAALPGDANGDGNVNILDIGIIVDNYDKSVVNPIADLNKDGKANIIDIGIVLDHYNK